MLFCCFEAFSGKFTENFFLVQKVTISEKSTEILGKFVFQVWKGENPEENLDLFKQLFLIKQVKCGKYQQKLVFLLKVSHIQLNYAFLLFWSIWEKFTENFSFYSKKWLSQKSALKYSERLFFLTCCFEPIFRKSTKNISFRWNKFFSHQNEPYTTKLSFSSVLKHFYGYWQKKFLWGKIVFFPSNELHTDKVSFSAV